MKKILMILVLLVPTMLKAQWTDEYGTWMSVGAKKNLGTKWSLGLEVEYRAQENSRWAFGLDAGYKLNKFLKFGAGYTLLYNRKKAKQSGDPAVDDEYKVTPAYTYPRHRFIVEATADKRFWKWLRISLRERYQLTYRPENDHEKITYVKQPVFDDDWNYLGDIWESETEVKTKLASTTQVLRSRLKLEVDKKLWKFSPFISAEACNSVSVGDHMCIDKVRTAIGTSYKINKKHEVSLGYILTFVFNDDDELNDKVEFDNRIHAVSVGYNYKF
ncbi:MAG: DUF2490 domain-containing protein [Bacteroidaceae bacterium]|nr:DUF2490 domain-containing protein [Bacteroidaceae bacterium]